MKSGTQLSTAAKTQSLPNFGRRSDLIVPDTHAKDARIIQVVESLKSEKKFFYKISVEWSDSTAAHAYRSYTDFFNFQCRLLDKFPEEAGARKSKRVIPFLPGRQVFSRNSRKLAEERLPQMDSYIVKLLKLHTRISQHVYVSNFLRDNWEEDLLRDGKHSSKCTGKKCRLGSAYEIGDLLEVKGFRDVETLIAFDGEDSTFSLEPLV